MKKFYRLMNEAGGLGEAGGADDGGAGGTGGAGGGGGGTEDTGSSSVPAWLKDVKLENVDDAILKDPALGPITNISGLVKSYVHAQRQIGQKGVLIPTENSTKEEWDTFYQKIGVPLEEAKYQESVKVDLKEIGVDEKFHKDYTKLAHELRLPPAQAKKVLEFFGKTGKESSESFIKATNEKMQAELDALQNEWGTDAYNVKLSKANKFLTENAGPEFMKYLKDSGLGKNAQLVKAFASVADKFYTEESIPGGEGKLGMTLNDIDKEINRAYDKDDPYMKPNHPDHKRRVDEIQKLFALRDKNARK